MTLAASDVADLEQEFGITFRDYQSQAITALGKNKDVILHVPTGGGKSVVFQAASRLLAPHGITVVVYPLRALIEDQQISAERFGVECIRYYGDVSQKDRKVFLERIKTDSSVTMVLTVPEMLQASKLLREALLARKVALMAIDEAHVYDEWALSFRSSYLKMDRVAKELNIQRLLLCSATLTAQGAAQAARVFKRTEWEVIRVPAIRPNLKFVSTNRDPVQFLREAVKSGTTPSPSPAIAFFTWKSTNNQTAETVKMSAGRDVLTYHADMTDKDRKRIQRLWTEGREWVLATKAFGMGIDKRNVRTIFHVQLPTSILDYAQEVGRAGRDGKDSYCYLPPYEPLTNGRTGALGDAAYFLVSRNYPTPQEIKAVWTTLHKHLHGKEGWHKVNPKKLADHLWRNVKMAPTVSKCITWLHLADMLKKRQRSTNWTFWPGDGSDEEPTVAKERSAFHASLSAIVRHGRSFDDMIVMSTGQLEDFVAPVAGVKDWKGRLKRWHKHGFIRCEWPGPMSTEVTVVADSFSAFNETGKILAEARRTAFNNLNKMIELAEAPAENRAAMIEKAISLDMVEFNKALDELRAKNLSQESEQHH